MPALPGWDAAAKATLAGESVRPAVFFRLDAGASGPLRYWLGDFDFPFVADGAVEVADCTYSGLGQIVSDLPALGQLLNGQAERLDFVLSGVPAEVVALALADAATVAGADLNIGFCMLDADLQQVTPVAWIAAMEAQTITVGRPRADGDPTRTVSLSATSVFAIRQQPQVSYYTPQDQRRRTSNDSFCDRKPTLTRGRTRKFGPTDA